MLTCLVFVSVFCYTSTDVCKTGSRESPINIETKTVRYQEYPPFILKGHENLSISEGNLKLMNTGETLKIETTLGNHSKVLLSGGPLNIEYEFVNMHFHWGEPRTCTASQHVYCGSLPKRHKRKIDEPGSEHQIDGKSYPLQLHMVYKSIQDETIETAVSHKNGLAVLGFKFQVVPDNVNVPGMDALMNKTSKYLNECEVQKCGNEYNGIDTREGHDINVVNFLPVLMDEYFYYRGSFTSGDCQEAVNWVIFLTPLACHRRHLDILMNMTRSNGKKIINNFRETQHVNGRPIYYHGVKLIKNGTIKTGSVNTPRRDLDYVPYNQYCPVFTDPKPAVMATEADRKTAKTLWDQRHCHTAVQDDSSKSSKGVVLSKPSLQVVCWLGLMLKMMNQAVYQTT